MSYCQGCADRDAELTRLRADLAAAEAQLANRRLCVTCGKYAPEGAGKYDENPSCTGPDGMNPCCFDLTPDEAVNHWRTAAHDLMAKLAAAEQRAREAEAERDVLTDKLDEARVEAQGWHRAGRDAIAALEAELAALRARVGELS